MRKAFIAAVVASAVVLLVACGDDGGGVATPSLTAAPETASATPGPVADASLAAFAQEVSDALGGADAAFFTERTVLQRYDCGGHSFPAPGPDCAAAGEGEGDEALVIGAFGSEGDVFDAEAYRTFWLDYLLTFDEGASDEYGGADVMMWALADLDPAVEGESEPDTHRTIVITRIAGAPVNPGENVIIGGPEGERVVLALFVTELADGWEITGLSRMPVALLDPTGDEAQALGLDELVDSWTPWNVG